MSDELLTQTRPLTAWNQAALRGYIRQVHCLETDGGREALDKMAATLNDALRLVCQRTPYMAGKLSLSQEQLGVILLHTESGAQIPCTTCDARENENLVYSKLREQGFPAGAFVGPLFDNRQTLSENGPQIPVAQILLILVDGGILMCVFVYHAITDGAGLSHFLSAVAAAMKDPYGFLVKPHEYPNRIDMPVPSAGTEHPGNDELVQALSNECPEFDLLEPGTKHEAHQASMYGLSEAKFGGIYVFGPEKLQMVKDAVVSAGYPINPSTFCCLTALSWAFMAATRLRTVGIADESRSRDTKCRIVIPTWWGDRLFQEQLSGYAGNAVAITATLHGAADLFTIAETPLANLAGAKDALMRVVRTIDEALRSVDEDFVKTRSTLFNSVIDPRLPQYNFTPADPKDFFFNSWRRLGADIEWTVPTASGPRLAMADAVRKTQNEWNESAGLIMPGRRDQKDYEVVLSSDADSIASLRSNTVWKTWYDRDIF
ncbi:hypothetical protein NLG97_g8626 [Lecanicillium saksenae]|uniref:Uncharacterized protein n=1 Tax=Lecanicillium saksenae TaxID=468837 RepID=A0ACC1QIH7_9HYPO|nr:hypothetical protein NLG97_g8626 [Lecanicillium saksenae]